MPGIGKYLVKGARRLKNCVKRVFVRENFFEQLGLHYFGPIDGKDIAKIEDVLREAKNDGVCSVVHICTRKGEGYPPAEREPDLYHGVSGFDIETGNIINGARSCSDVFGDELCRLAELDDRICAVTAAMKDGTGLVGFASRFPERFFDVGIAEEHAVTFAAGLAAGGLKPVVAIYSSFLQRAYDQILHDVCIQNLPVVFAIDRAGLVGSDGETHQGIFDLSYLSSIPGMHIMAPKNKWELSDMMKFAVSLGAPIAVRYPRGEAYAGLKEYRAPIEMGRAEPIYVESEICLMAVGSMVKTAEKVWEQLKAAGYRCSLINARFVKPIDENAVEWAAKNHQVIVSMEENVASGGYGEKVRQKLDELHTGVRLIQIAIPDEYVEHGNVDLLKKEIGIDAETIVEKIKKEMEALG